MINRHLTCAAAACLGVAVATAAAAQSRPYAPELSCASVRDVVKAEGGVVIGTSRITYDRYVSDGRFCAYNQITKPEWIRTADDDECFVGYTCKERDGNRFD